MTARLWYGSRRRFLKTSGALAGAAAARAALPRLATSADSAAVPEVEVRYPQDRVPLSFIIDDSTCLVNMGHFCMPQFAAAWPERSAYDKPWRTWPREIPDRFVREFGQWCAEHGVKGKYSVVPYPACVGWLDRELPGWSRRELLESLQLVRELMLPNWDIHPEMITHTRVIDLATGRPHAEIRAATMENSYPQSRKSVDELAAYLAYALRILRNCDLPCEGITTPGGFGNQVKAELPAAVWQAVRDVYQAELPHYFKYIRSGDQSTEPTLELLEDLDSDDPRVTVNVPAGTGDWFGGWDGAVESRGHRYANESATQGRMVELIERGQPAVMLCHWPGMYTNGTREGFADFQRVVVALEQRFAERTLWMKVSEIARYWAAKELTQIEPQAEGLALQAPFATDRFTLRISAPRTQAPRIVQGDQLQTLEEVTRPAALRTGTWLRQRDGRALLCFQLPKGRSYIKV